jgi:two-component system copper resistance phosphate regulon response regulator CusR
VVEDERKLADLLARGLREEGHAVDVASRGEDAVWMAQAAPFDVIVLDVMLPGLDGFSILKSLRSVKNTPVIMLTARDGVADRVRGLQDGADDYLVKPFSMKELVARVRAAARRGIRREETPRGEPIEVEELLIDPREVQAYVDGESAELTPTEFRLLYQLALDRGRVSTRDELLQKLWGRRESHRDRTVDVFVRRLREKIDRRASRHTFIQTRYGVGYKLEAVPKDRAAASGAR